MPVRVIPRTVAVLAVVASLHAFVRLSAQQQAVTPPQGGVTFQVEVNFVDIDAIVTDERGDFVADLSKEDFELFEDGKRQQISTFALVDIPGPRQETASAGRRPSASSDVRSNAQPISGRLYVIVLDDLNVSPLRSKVVV